MIKQMRTKVKQRGFASDPTVSCRPTVLSGLEAHIGKHGCVAKATVVRWMNMFEHDFLQSLLQSQNIITQATLCIYLTMPQSNVEKICSATCLKHLYFIYTRLLCIIKSVFSNCTLSEYKINELK